VSKPPAIGMISPRIVFSNLSVKTTRSNCELLIGYFEPGVVMSDVLQMIAVGFCHQLKARYEGCYRLGAPAKGIRWLNSLAIFTALQACRDEIGNSDLDEPTWRRFTIGGMGKIADENLEVAKEVRNYLINTRTVNPTLDKPRNRLSEWMNDFSIGYGTIEESYGKGGARPTGLRLLMAAESEFSPRDDDVKADMLRILLPPSPLRVMIFRLREEGITDMVNEFLKANDVHHKWPGVKWLFVAIPTYAQWLDMIDVITSFPCQILTAADGAVHDRTTWWSSST
jgi:hypothetical protein